MLIDIIFKALVSHIHLAKACQDRIGAMVIIFGDMVLQRFYKRLRLSALWFLGCILVLPFAAVLVYTLGDYAISLVNELKNLKLPAFTLSVKQSVLLVGGAVLLLCPVLPLKNLLPAVYLRKAKEARNAQA